MFDIPPLPAGQPIADQNGQPTLAFALYWQQLVENLETTIIDIQTTLDIASARMPEVAPIIVTANSGGVVNPGQLPRYIPFKRFKLNTDVTTAAAWSATILSGSATYSMGAATGVLEITALVASTSFEITSVHDGVTLTAVLVVTKQNAAAAAPSGGGSTATDSALLSFNSATHAAVSVELSVVAGSAGTVTLTAADLIVTTDAIGPPGFFDVFGKWQWDSTGAGAWVDVGTEDASDPDASVTLLGPGMYETDDGTLTSNEVKTGLVAASTHKFRLMARNASGTRTMYLSGTATAVGS